VGSGEPVVKLLAEHKHAILSALASTQSKLASPPWFDSLPESALEGEPALEQPCATRRGRVQETDGQLWTKCPRGGRRPWFLCEPPGRYCGRRVALLYSGGELFACRRCYGLAYESQQQSEFLRGLRKAQKIRVRLGGTPNLLHPFPEKPKGMHWRSYRRIKRVYETAKRSSK
jgi:hypothetical protein